jgi:hypothetical protein
MRHPAQGVDPVEQGLQPGAAERVEDYGLEELRRELASAIAQLRAWSVAEQTKGDSRG